MELERFHGHEARSTSDDLRVKLEPTVCRSAKKMSMS
jgi:hypothetical protein